MRKKHILAAVLTFLMVVLMSVSAWAVPQSINYQGVVADASGALNGTYDMEFELYIGGTSSGWVETHTGVIVT
ncbi:MAG: hypothetical protein JSV56_01225, partial [Methanomassiliicoccales archaeon]